MRRLFLSFLLFLSLAGSGLLATQQSAHAGPPTSCNVTAAEIYVAMKPVNGNLSCVTTSVTGAAIADSVLIRVNGSSTTATIGKINSSGGAWVGAPDSLSVSGGGATCTPNPNNTVCTGLIGGVSVITFSDARLSGFGTLSFTWGNTGTDVRRVGTISTTASPDKPSVQILNAPTNHTGADFNVTFQFSETVTGFVAGDVSVNNGTLSNFVAVDGDTYTADISPVVGQQVTIDVPADVAKNIGDVNNSAATQVTVQGFISPGVQILNAPAQHSNAPFSITVQFSEDVTGFASNEITVVGGGVSNFNAVDARNYTAQINPNAYAPITIDVGAGVAQSTASATNNLAASQVSVTAPAAPAPTVSIQNAPTQHSGSDFNVTFQFSEIVTGFIAGDIVVTNANVSNFVAVDGDTYTADISPSGTAAITIDVNAAAAKSAHNVDSLAASQVTVQGFTPSAPTVQIQNAPGSHTGAVFNITFEFSQNVTGFADSDVIIANGALSNFVSVDGNTYTADVTPVAGQDVTIDVPANVANSPFSLGNLAAPQVTISSSSVKETREKIGNFIQNRATTMLSIQPSLSGFLDGSNNSGGGPLGNLKLSANSESTTLAFSSSLSRIRAARRGDRAANAATALAAGGKDLANAQASNNVSSYASSSQLANQSAAVQEIAALDAKTSEATEIDVPEDRFDVWTELYASHSRANSSRADMIMGFLGAHYFVTPDLLIGAMVQYDSVDEKNGTSKTDGTGWMAGPYIAGRFPGQHLLYEARVAWGQSNNKISPLGTYQDKFDTERWLISGQLKGDYNLALINQMTKVTLNPFVRASYYQETQQAYTNALGAHVASQTVSMGEVQFGPKLKLETVLANGLRLAPSISAAGVWNFATSSGAASNGQVLGDGDFRARLDAGLGITTAYDWRFDFSSFYDGIGVEDYEAYGGKARLTIPLN